MARYQGLLSISRLLSKGAGSDRCEQLLVAGDTVRQREFEVLGDQLLDVWSLDIVFRGEFDDLEDLLQVVLLVHVMAIAVRIFLSKKNNPSVRL